MGRPVPAAAATLRRLVCGLAMTDLREAPLGTALTNRPVQALNGRAESCIAIAAPGLRKVGGGLWSMLQTRVSDEKGGRPGALRQLSQLAVNLTHTLP